jgi:hypothetical protein
MESTTSPKFGKQGPARISDSTSEYNSLAFLVRQILGRADIATMCTVIAVTGGGVNKAPYVDLQILLNQVDGYGNSIPNGVLYNVPCFRMQNGANAIICDPQVGDVGLALFSDKDISALKSNYNNNTMASVLSGGINPATRRRFDVADGMYFGGFYNEVPTNYIQLLNGVINISAPEVNVTSWAGWIAAFGMGTPPAGWLACPTAQTLVSAVTYPRLLAALGTTWGGDGSTTVGLPFFPTGYVPLAGTAGVLSHGKVKNHTHNYDAVNASFTYAQTGGPQYGSHYTGVTSNPNSPEGGVDNLAAGYGVQYCVKY